MSELTTTEAGRFALPGLAGQEVHREPDGPSARLDDGWPAAWKWAWSLVAIVVGVLWGSALLVRLAPPHPYLDDFCQEWTSARNWFEGRPIYLPLRESIPLCRDGWSMAGPMVYNGASTGVRAAVPAVGTPGLRHGPRDVERGFPGVSGPLRVVPDASAGPGAGGVVRAAVVGDAADQQFPGPKHQSGAVEHVPAAAADGGVAGGTQRTCRDQRTADRHGGGGQAVSGLPGALLSRAVNGVAWPESPQVSWP